MKHESDLDASLRQLIESCFPRLCRSVRKNLARLTCAFLCLALSVRFGYGSLHLTSVARALPEGGKFKSRYKWLSRSFKPASEAAGSGSVSAACRTGRGSRFAIDMSCTTAEKPSRWM